MNAKDRVGASGVGAVFLLLLIAVGIGFLGTHHIVMTKQGLRTYPKSSFMLSESYVDMTSTSLLGLRGYPGTTAAMLAAGDVELLPGGTTLKAVADIGQSVEDAINRFDSEGQIRANMLDVGNQAMQLGQNAAAQYRRLDEKYDITNKARAAAAGAAGLTAKGLKALNKALEGGKGGGW